MATTYPAGDAKLSIIPDMTGFKRKLEADMSRVQAQFGIDVTAHTAQARADINRLRTAEQAKALQLDVHGDLAKLRAELDTLRVAEKARAITIPVRIDRSSHVGIDADARALAGRFGASFKTALAVNLAAVSIPGGISLVATLAGALQQLSQSALAVPGAMSAAGSSIGTLAMGLSGVKDAWTAINTEASQAGSTHQRIAAQSAVAAQGLSRAQRDLSNAYRDTRRELEDLNLSLRGGQLSEQQAIINAQKARRDLAADLAKGQIGDQLDYQDRLLGIAQADQAVAEAHQRNIELQQQATEANAKGVAGADRVVAAHEAVTEAQARATEAATQSGAAAEAAAAAMANLAPNAQTFLTTLQSLKPEFGELRTLVQNNLFAGLSDSMRTLAGNDLPVLKEGLGGISTAWNDTLKTLMGAAGSESTQGLLAQLLGNTAEAQSRINAAIDPLVHAFGVLSVAGSQTLPHLADVMDRLATRFDTFITAADKDGRLQKWIADGEAGIGHLSDTLFNVGKAMSSISQAMGGEGMLATLDRLTEKMANFLGSGEGQAEMQAFFTTGREQLEAWKPILAELPDIFRGLYNAAVDSANTFLPVLRTIAELLGDNPELVTALVTAFLTWKTIRPIISGVQDGMALLSGAIVNVGTNFAPLKDKAKNAMDGVDAEFVKAGKQGSGMSKFAGGLSALAGVGGGGLALLTTVGVPLVTAFVTKFTSDMDDAEDSARSLNDEARRLISSLEAITNLTGAAFRDKVAKEYSTGHGDMDGADAADGLRGDALKAALDLGVGGKEAQDLITATMPGGEQQYNDIMGQLREKSRPRVQDFIRDQGINMDDAKSRGIDENTILDAWLGVKDAVKKLQDWTQLGQNVVDLGQLWGAAKDLGPDDPFFQSSLIAQRLNALRSGTDSGIAEANRERNAATPQRRLRPEFANQFAGAAVSNNADGTAIVSTTPPEGMALDSGTTVTRGVAPNEDKWTYVLSPDDAAKYTYRQGGPTPSGTGPGPTGGFMAEIHSDEWVLPEHARKRVGDQALWALTQGRSFDVGGYIDDTGNPVTPGMAPGPSTGPIAPNPTSGGSGLLGAFLSGMSGTLGNVVNMGASLTGSTLPGAPSAGGATLSQQAGVTPTTTVGSVEGLVSSRMAQIPGLWGLVGSALSPDPVGASMQWAGQTLDWAASSGMNILGSVGSTLWSGALGAVGMQNSILSPDNIYNQALSSTVGYFTGGAGPAGTLLGMNGGAGIGIPGLGGIGGGGVPGGGQLGSQSITLGDGSTIQIPTYGTSSGMPGGGSVQSYLASVSGLIGSGGPGGAGVAIPGGVGGTLVPGQWAQIDALGQKFGLSMTSGYRSANGPTVAGVPAGQSFHAVGRAHDYSNTPGGSKGSPEELAFAQYMVKAYGSQLKELIFDYPGFSQTIKDGRIVGPFGAYYTLDQAGYHGDHVHIAFAGGGPVSGPGGPTGDKIPAWLSDDEHVFSAADVAAMGGQRNVSAFRAALHRATGGPVNLGMVPPDPTKPIPAPPRAVPPPGNPNAIMPIGTPPPALGTPAATPGAPPAAGQAPTTPPPGDGAPAPAGDPASPDHNPGEDITRAAEKLTEAGGAGMGAAPASREHTLPALNSAVMSGASTLSSWINTAVSAAAAGATMGAGGGAGAGMASPLISGGIQQGAKILTGGLNVLSSLMVGNIPGSYGSADDPTGYGQVVRPQQRAPITAPTSRVQNNTFHGMDTARVFQELDLREAQDRQATLAGYRG